MPWFKSTPDENNLFAPFIAIAWVFLAGNI